MIQTDNGGDMMYFYQVLQSCDEFKVVSEFLAMIKSSEKMLFQSEDKRDYKGFASDNSQQIGQ